MFFKKQKAQKERKAKEERLGMLMDLNEEFQNLFTDARWYGLIDSDFYVGIINEKLESIAKKFPEYRDQILNCKEFRDTELPAGTKIAFTQLGKTQDGTIYAFCTSEKTTTAGELRQNKEQYVREFGPTYNNWYLDKANIGMANIHWPYFTYLVHLYKNVIPRIKASVEKLTKKNELEIFCLKRELGYPAYGD